MAGKSRIRSIKPEFWTDEKISRLEKSTALFFISIWNFADDQGIIEDNSRGIALRTPMFRSQDIEKMLMSLWRNHLIARASVCNNCFNATESQCDQCAHTSPSPLDIDSLEPRRDCEGLVLIRGWRHQKIDKPNDGKWKNKKINWLTHSGSAIALYESLTGSDRKRPDERGGDKKERLSSEKMDLENGNNLPRLVGNKPSEVDIAEAISYYREQIQIAQKAHCLPFVSTSESEIVRRLLGLNGMTLVRLKTLINTYVYMQDEWFQKKGYDLATLEQNLQKVFSKAGARMNADKIEINRSQPVALHANSRHNGL